MPVDETASFEKLQRAVKEVKQKETDLKTLIDSIDDEDGLIVRYQMAQNLEVKIEEKEVACQKLKAKIEMVQKLILAKRRITYEVNDKLEKKSQETKKLSEKADGYAAQVDTNAQSKQKTKNVIRIMNRLLAFRKIYMLKEIQEIFKIDIDGGPASMKTKRNTSGCRCVLVDTIRGLHLPHVASIQLSPHKEKETVAAVGLLVHAVDTISRVLDYSLPYPVDRFSTPARIYCPLENKWATLSGWKKRSEREKFFEGLGWIGKNIAQIRSDCGIPTPIADKTLSVLADWIRSVTEGKYVCIYERPMTNSSSPSSILINFDPQHSQSTSPGI